MVCMGPRLSTRPPELTTMSDQPADGPWVPSLVFVTLATAGPRGLPCFRGPSPHELALGQQQDHRNPEGSRAAAGTQQQPQELGRCVPSVLGAVLTSAHTRPRSDRPPTPP